MKINTEDSNKIVLLVNWRKELKNSEGLIEEYYWKPLINILSKNEKGTIDFLKNCNDEILYWISEIFEDISEIFQSKDFVEFLKELQQQHPNADMEQDIKYAEYAIED